MSTTPLYEIRNVRRCYGARCVLDIANLSIPKGGALGLVGPNGSGKSTLLNLLGFLDAPQTGQILFNGTPFQSLTRTERLNVTLLPQASYLLKRTVYENVAYGLSVRGQRECAPDRVNESLVMVGLAPERFLTRAWHELSGGEARRVALAARLAVRPKVLLLDEPVANVDNASAQLIRSAILHAQTLWGTTLVISGHDLEWVRQMCNHMVQLHMGRIAGNELDTVICGDWKAQEGAQSVLTLADGQLLFAPGRDTTSCTAVLDGSKLDFVTFDTNRADNSFTAKGVVTSLSLHQPTTTTLVTVLVSPLTFRLQLTCQQVADLRLAPGSPVSLRYNADAVRWL